MRRVSPEIPRMHAFLRRINSLAIAADSGEIPPLQDVLFHEPPIKCVKALAKLPLAGHERYARDQAVRLCSWYSGRNIIGLGEESLAIRTGDHVTKYASRPQYDVEWVANELTRRYECMLEYLGDMVVRTQFSPGVVDGRRPAGVVVIDQEYVDHVGEAHMLTANPDVRRKLHAFQAAAILLAEEQGMYVDVHRHSNNLVLDRDGNLQLIDTIVVTTEDEGKRYLLSPYISDCANFTPHIYALGMSV